MDREGWLIAVGSVVVGALLVTLVEWIRGQIERRQRRRDRRDDFQRDTLLTLLDALLRLAHLTALIHIEVQHGRPVSDELDELRRQESVKVSRYSVVTLDERTRTPVTEFQHVTTKLTGAAQSANHDALSSELIAALNRVIDRIGELLRKL